MARCFGVDADFGIATIFIQLRIFEVLEVMSIYKEHTEDGQMEMGITHPFAVNAQVS